MNMYENANKLLNDYADQSNLTIREHSFAAPMMLVLLRHAGCSFCRRTLKELSVSMRHITGCGYNVGLVHMDPDDVIAEQLVIYGLDGISRFYDPERKLYRALGLPRAPLRSAFKVDIWKKSVSARREFGISWPKTDPLQLPGVFLVDQGMIVAGESTLSPDEHPDFLALLIRSEALA